DGLARAVPKLLEAGMQGWNCTLPHKNEMFRLVTRRDSSAAEAQSVNTVRVESGQLHGFSTDAAGWEAAIHEAWHVQTTNLRILILGCGGVGQTLARHLTRSGCGSLTLLNRHPQRAKELALELQPIAAGRFPIRAIPWKPTRLAPALAETDLLVNATSLGLHEGDAWPLPPDFLQPPLRVYDTIYRKNLTPWIRAARQRGCPAEDGLGMLLHQGLLSLEIWTGKKAPRAEMEQALGQAAERKN
ncbi:MAG: shikimate dehydrogenase, partial [Verrucomicrobia bacterium]|nr:shikimate dehydrogenase [Verrucomicrobiota bacterium]